jgi:ABC-type lipoprotein export system ATPase subunit
MLEAKQIGKKFSSAWIIKNVNLSVQKGDLFLITGVSGAGKTTLLHIIAGLLEPSAGEVYFQGQNIYALSDKKKTQLRGDFFSFLFQSDYLIEELSVLENIYLPLQVLKERGELDNKKIVYYEDKSAVLSEKMEIKDLLNEYPRRLSPGQKQRIAFCRSIIKDPEIVFMDEPFSSLDYKNKEILSEIIYDYWKTDKTIVLVTHEAELIKEYTQRLTL